MKTILLLIVLAGAGWWYFVGSRTINEGQVTGFYQAQQAATLERKPEVLCALLADDFSATGSIALAGSSRNESVTRQQLCDGYVDMYAAWEKLGSAMGGEVQLDSHYDIHAIEIAPDKKSATVDISMSLDVAGNLTNMRSRSTETLVRRNGKVLLLRSEGTASVGAGE